MPLSENTHNHLEINAYIFIQKIELHSIGKNKVNENLVKE